MKRKWILRGSDYNRAIDYIERKLQDKSYWAHRPFDALHYARESWSRLNLNEKNVLNWIARHFDPIQTNKLRTALRVAKSRQKNPTASLSIDLPTHQRLAEYANRYGVTLSEAIDRLLDLANQQDRQAKLF